MPTKHSPSHVPGSWERLWSGAGFFKLLLSQAQSCFIFHHLQTVKWWLGFGVGCMIWRMCEALLRCAFVNVIDPCALFLLQVVRAGFESEFYLMKQSAGWAQMSTSSVNFFEKCDLLLCIPSKFWNRVLVEWGHAPQVCVLYLSQPSLQAVGSTFLWLEMEETSEDAKCHILDLKGVGNKDALWCSEYIPFWFSHLSSSFYKCHKQIPRLMAGQRGGRELTLPHTAHLQALMLQHPSCLKWAVCCWL